MQAASFHNHTHSDMSQLCYSREDGDWVIRTSDMRCEFIIDIISLHLVLPLRHAKWGTFCQICKAARAMTAWHVWQRFIVQQWIVMLLGWSESHSSSSSVSVPVWESSSSESDTWMKFFLPFAFCLHTWFMPWASNGASGLPQIRSFTFFQWETWLWLSLQSLQQKLAKGWIWEWLRFRLGWLHLPPPRTARQYGWEARHTFMHTFQAPYRVSKLIYCLCWVLTMSST